MIEPNWLQWIKKLEAIGQTGLTYASNPFDIERYESVRALAAEMLATLTSHPLDQVMANFPLERGYATPKVIVRGAVFQEDSLLLVRERRDGKWTLPGGFADVGLSGSENIEKEIFEESGYKTRAKKLIAVYDKSHHPHPPSVLAEYMLFFQCELLGGAPTLSIETDEVAFFKESEIANLALSLPRTIPEQIALVFRHWQNPNLPTEFD